MLESPPPPTATPAAPLEQGHQLKALFRTMLDAVLVADDQANYIDANPAASDLLGYSREELLTMSVADVKAGAEEDDFRERWADFLAQGQFIGEYQLRRKNGTTLEVELRAVANVLPGTHVAVMRDVTERKREEAAVQSQRELLQTVLDHIPVMVNLLDSNGKLIWVNRHWQKVLGWTLEEARLVDISAEFYPDAADRQWVASYIREASTGWADFKTRIRDGRILDTSWSTVRLSDGTTIGIGQDITERKRAEQALRESEGRFRQVAENIEEVFWMSDPATRQTLYISPAYEKVWGRSCESLYQNPASFFEAVHPDDKPRLLAAIQDSPNTGGFEEQYRIQRLDGSTRWIWDRAFPVYDDNGDLCRIVGIAQDITERRNSLEALHQSERRFRALTEKSWDGVALFSKEGIILYGSPSTMRMLGYSVDEFIGKPMFDFIHEDDAEIALRQLQASLDNPNQGLLVQARVRHKNGAYLWLEGVFTNQVDEPALGGIVNNFRDITERKQAEADLVESQQRLQIALTRGNIGLWDWNIENGICQMSSQMRTLLGYDGIETKDDVAFWKELVHPEDYPDSRERLKACLASDSTYYRNEFRFRDSNGGYHWILSQGTVFRRPNNEAYRILGVHLDITPMKQAEAELRASRTALQEAHDDLEKHVEERTAELGKANHALKVEILERQMIFAALQETMLQLETAKEVAEQASSAKNDFLSRVSHELRTPLNAILGFGQLLARSELNKNDREAVDFILAGGKHLLDLINEVLDIARIEAGRLSLSLEPIEVAPAVREVLDIVRPLATPGDIEIINEIDQHADWFIKADHQRFRQVLLNLLSNAIKYNHDGGQVMVSATLVPQHPPVLRILVRDTGLGLSADELTKIFTPFERLKAAQSGIEGTGIGLALSKKLTEAMGGRIGVESTLQSGSTFWIELLISDDILKDNTESLPAIVSASPGEDDLQNSADTILYIEDNPLNLKLLEKKFARNPNIVLLTASDGQLGLDMTRQHRPKLILLDLHLPDINGDEVLRQLQADTETRDIPVIILSADAMPAQIARMKAAGAASYLTKPLNLTELLAVVQDLLESGKG